MTSRRAGTITSRAGPAAIILLTSSALAGLAEPVETVPEGIPAQLEVGKSVLVESPGPDDQQFKVTWLGPGPHDRPPHDLSRGQWETDTATGEAKWKVITDYAIGFGWWPYLFTEFDVAGTEGAVLARTRNAEACPDGSMIVVTHVEDDSTIRVALLERTAGACQNYDVEVTVTGATNKVTLTNVLGGQTTPTFALVEIDAAGEATLTGPHPVDGDPKAKALVDYISSRRAAQGWP